MNISIVIPCRELNEDTSQLLQSLYYQEGGKFKLDVVVVVDKGKVNPEFEKIFKTIFQRIEFHYVNFGSAAAARNYGCRATKFQTVLFIDSDVILEETFISSLENVYSKNPAVCKVLPVNKKNIYSYTFSKYVLRTNYYEGFKLLPSTCFIVEKEIFDSIGGFDEEFKNVGGEDYDFFLRLQVSGEIIDDKHLYVHHKNPENLVNFLARSYSYSKNQHRYQEKIYQLTVKDLLNSDSKFNSQVYLIALQIFALYPVVGLAVLFKNRLKDNSFLLSQIKLFDRKLFELNKLTFSKNSVMLRVFYNILLLPIGLVDSLKTKISIDIGSEIETNRLKKLVAFGLFVVFNIVYVLGSKRFWQNNDIT